MRSLKDLKKKATEYMEIANKNWDTVNNDFYICYSYSELASDVIYKLFEKDAFNEVATVYTEYNKYGSGGIKVLCELEENIYFSFIIYNVTGMFGDNGCHVTDGKFTIMKDLPKEYKDIWELFDSENEESEE